MLDDEVAGKCPGEVDEDGFASGDLAGVGKGVCQLDGALAIRGVLENDFERQDSGAWEIDGECSFGEESMRGEAVGIGIEDLFGGDECVEGVGAEGHLALGQLRGVACVADHAFQESAFLAGAFELGGAEGLAAVVEGRVLAQERVEDGDGIVEVFALDCGETFLVLFTQWPRDGL